MPVCQIRVEREGSETVDTAVEFGVSAALGKSCWTSRPSHGVIGFPIWFAMVIEESVARRAFIKQ